MESVSPWQWKRKKKPPVQWILPTIRKEIAELNAFLDTFPKVKKVTFLQGNHEVWLDNLVEEQGCQEFNCYLTENALKIKERKWNYLPYGEYYRIGSLYFTHGGQWTTKHHSKAYTQNTGENVVYAHVHDVQRFSQSSLDGIHAAFAVGCLKKKDGASNPFLKGRSHNWSHGVMIVDWWGDGSFRADQVDITDGHTVVWGNYL